MNKNNIALAMGTAARSGIEYLSPIRKGVVRKLFEGECAVFDTSQKCIAFSFGSKSYPTVEIFQPLSRVWCHTFEVNSKYSIKMGALYNNLAYAKNNLVSCLLREEELLLARLLEHVTFVPAEKVKRTQKLFDNLNRSSFVLSEEDGIDYSRVHCLVRSDPTVAVVDDPTTMHTHFCLYEMVALAYIL